MSHCCPAQGDTGKLISRNNCPDLPFPEVRSIFRHAFQASTSLPERKDQQRSSGLEVKRFSIPQQFFSIISVRLLAKSPAVGLDDLI